MLKHNKIIVLVFVSIFTILNFASCSLKGKEEKGQVLHTVTTAKLKGMDPIYAEDLYSNTEISRVYEGLLQYHPYKRPYVVEPLLAEAMPTISKNGLTYTFKIRQGVKFHDDKAFADGKGREVTAQDFVYSFKRLADPKLQSTGWWLLDGRLIGLNEWREKQAKAPKTNYDEEVEGLKATDKYTLQVQLKAPFPQFLYALTMPYTAVVAKEAVEKYGKEFLNHAVGTGPFVLESFRGNEGVTYVKNPNYWPATFPTEGAPGDKEAGLLEDAGKPIPFLDRIEVRVIVEDQPRWMHFVRGETEYSSIPKDNYKQVMTTDRKLTEEYVKKGIQYELVPALDLTYVAFNTESTEIPQFKDKRVRQAISIALDEKDAIELFYNGLAVPAQLPVPPGINGGDANYKNPYRSNDIAKAKKLLADAGYPEGKGLPVITYDTMADTTSRQMFEYTEKQLARIGVKLKINSNTWPALLERIQRRQVQMWGMAWGADYPDAENFLQLFYGPNAQPGGMNNTYYKNKEFDRLFEKARIMQDTPERTKLYKQLALMVAEDCPMILGVHRIGLQLRQPWVKNLKIHEFVVNLAKYVRIDLDAKKKYKK
jgi:oligopeptide transport system substrate-binding protein